ncbi:MAG TPA: alpha/beta hydrolase [Bacteroides sp.]|nr:alpha/beta hydrolase [Bacteroides sp.]
MSKPLLYLLLALLAVGFCHAKEPEKYVPSSERKKIKYATPEPGTYLKPAAYHLLNQINRVMEDPGSFEKPGNWIYRIFTPRMKKTLDTLITYNERPVPVRIYYPSGESMKGDHPVTLFIHGGGFSFGSVEEYHMMVGKLAEVTGTIMVSVEYRLAPEHPFPAAVNDAYEALCWLREHAGEIGGDPDRICVMGDSAGGNIATVLTLRCRDDGRPGPACQVLIYPGVTFVDTIFSSRVYFGLGPKRFVLDEKFLRQVKSDYMGDLTDPRHPYLSPLEAELTPDLPPALVITAECDPIRDGGRAYAEKLLQAGVEVEHIEYSGMIHGFLSFHMILSDAVEAMEYIRDYLQQVFKKM